MGDCYAGYAGVGGGDGAEGQEGFLGKGTAAVAGKAMSTGLPGAGGILSWGVEGAREPIVGMGALEREGGKAQEESS